MTTLNPTAPVATAPARQAGQARARDRSEAKATKAAPAAPKEPKAGGFAHRARPGRHNPKKPGSKAFTRFALYNDGQTVADALAAGVRPIDIAWDSRRKHIELLPPA